MTQRTFHSFAHYAATELGHPFVYHQSFQKAAEELGGTCYVYAPMQCGIPDLPPRWIKWFHAIYNRKNRSRFWKECIRLFRTATGVPHRTFFIEMFSRRDFFPFAFSLLFFSKKNDKVWILYRDDLALRRKKDRLVIFAFTWLIQKKFGSRFTPMTDSGLLADYYEEKMKRPVLLMPIPHIDFSPRSYCFAKKEKLICSLPGQPRKEKGEDVIEKLIKIQDPAASRIELDLSGATCFSAVKNGLSIHLRKAFLTREEYHESLFRSDVILLPHEAAIYKRRTSGIFVETILAGKIPLVQKGSWLATELSKFDLHELMINWDDPLLFTNLFSILEQPKLWEKLQVMQEEYKKFHSLSTFIEKIKHL